MVKYLDPKFKNLRMGVSLLATLAVLGLGTGAAICVIDTGAAMASSHDDGGGHEGGGHSGGGNPGRGSAGGGHDDGGHDDGGHEDGGHEDGGHEGGGREGGGHADGGHEGGGSEGGGHDGGGRETGGQGARNSSGQAGNSGQGPVWAREGIPEVELGRLNVVRSPSQVLGRALSEALATLNPELVAFYSLSHTDMINELSLNWGNVAIYDSPLQNLALLGDALDGNSVLTSNGVTNTNDTLTAVFLGIASDKTIPITTNTVIAVTTILGTPITGQAAADLAARAEAIRIAALAGHG